MLRRLLLLVVITSLASYWFRPASAAEAVELDGGSVRLRTGILERTISVAGDNVATSSLRIAGREMLSSGAREFSVTISRAEPNRRPPGLKPAANFGSDVASTFRRGQRLDPAILDDRRLGLDVRWADPITICSAAWSEVFSKVTREVSRPRSGVTRLTIVGSAKAHPTLGDMTIRLCYELYQGHPVTRKWIEVANTGSNWLKLDNLWIDDLSLSSRMPKRTLLTPAEYDAEPSVVAQSANDETLGVIAGNEVPSALRAMAKEGPMGYRPEYFEWILGPGETFVSEPVFLYAFHGDVWKTVSASSTPLDRVLEGPYKEFLHKYVGIAADTSPYYAPQWLTWESFYENVDDAIIRKMADLAAKAGFVQFVIDDGWQQGRLGTQPNTETFPDFADTCRHIKSRGLKLGLWLSCYRDPESPDLQQFPDARCLPLNKIHRGYGMSFASPWRDYYVDDLARLHERFGTVYFKQDFSNIISGDVNERNEGRTRKDSLLRSLRRLLEVQDTLRRQLPEVTTQITHEIYWNTPGVPADLAVVKYCDRYHIPPNACLGGVDIPFHDPRAPGEGKAPKPVRPGRRPIDAAGVRQKMLDACFKARELLHAHRGLPLECLEFYAAATLNFQETLTTEIQDRQICSWLMGAPLVFSGNLSMLTDENLNHYRQRFEIVKRLHDTYGIYRLFQSSGVPAPTDTDWHWWGKLNGDGCGAVVVVRGGGGQEGRDVNIPWVHADRRYGVTALLKNKKLGTFTGTQLQSGQLQLKLPVYGQEILEVTDER